MNALRLLPRTVQLCTHCQHNPAGFWVGHTGATLVRRPWCLACCAELDPGHYHVIPFDAAQPTGHDRAARRTPGHQGSHRVPWRTARTGRTPTVPGDRRSHPSPPAKGRASTGLPPKRKDTPMTSTPPAHRTPGPWRSKAAVLAAAITAAGLATIPAVAASAAPAAAALSGPTIHEQQALNQNIPVATGNVHTTALSSPVLAAHSYLVNLAIGVYNITPGSVVLCGLTTSTNGDVVTVNYGQIENEATTASSGNCAVTGTVTLNNPSDHIIAWATVYTGPGGATIGDTSMNEQPVGTVVITH